MGITLKENIIDILKDQAMIFGEDLYFNLNLTENTIPPLQNEPVSIPIQKQKVQVQHQEIESDVSHELFNSANTIEELEGLINKCKKCQLGSTRKNFVFGTGNPDADVLIVGEAPGADEDDQGKPFVGRAGQLLTDILKAIKFERDEVFIANILKCRPPNNRNPLPEEMELCLPYLQKQIDIIKPKAILCLGLVAAKGLLNQKLSLTKMRGNVYEFEGIKTMVTYHPAALLRNPNWKRGCWEDVQKFRKLYEESID